MYSYFVNIRYAMPLLILLLVSGCAGTHLYNKANHDLAQKVEENFEEVNIPKILKDERARLEETLNRELDVVRRHTLARRDARLLAALVDDKTSDFIKNFGKEISTRRTGLGNDVQDFINFLDVTEQDKKLLQSIENAYVMMAKEKVDPKLICVDPRPSKSEFSSSRLKQTFDRYCRVSDDIAQTVAALEKYKGLIHDTLRTIKKIEANRQQFAKELKATKDAFTKKTQEIKTAKNDPKIAELEQLSKQFDRLAGGYRLDDAALKRLKELTEPKMSEDVLEKLAEIKDKKPMRKNEFEKLIQKMIGEEESKEKTDVIVETIVENSSKENPALTDAADRLEEEEFGDLGLAGVLRQIEEQRAMIDDLIKAFLGGDPEEIVDDPAIKSSVKIAAHFGLLHKTINQPRLSALILQSEQLKIQRDELKKRISNAEQRLTLLKSKGDALIMEYNFLVEAGKYLGFAAADKCAETLYDNFKPEGNQECAENLMRALVLYMNSWSIGRLKQEEIDYQIIGLRHTAALDDSEVALRQWNNLIGVSISQLSALHASGIRPELIARWVHAITNAGGLFYIGAEVD